MADTIVAQADALRAAANAFAALQQSQDLDEELRVILKTSQDAVRALEAAGQRLETLGVPLGGVDATRVHAAARAVRESNEALEADVIAYARSPAGHALWESLRETTATLERVGRATWAEVQSELCAPIPLTLVATLAKLQPLRVDAESVLQAWRPVALLVGRVEAPSVQELQLARTARVKVDQGLARLYDRVPEDIRPELISALEGELRIIDVSDELLGWIRDSRLEDSFFVRAR